MPPETWPPASTLPANSCSEIASRSGGTAARTSPTCAATISRPGRDSTQSAGTVAMAGSAKGSSPASGAKTMMRWNSVWLSHFSRKGPKSALKWLAPGSGGATAIRCASATTASHAASRRAGSFSSAR